MNFSTSTGDILDKKRVVACVKGYRGKPSHYTDITEYIAAEYDG
jgi:hypothetical protein